MTTTAISRPTLTKAIYECDLTITPEIILVELIIGIEEDEDWSMTEHCAMSHTEFMQWLSDNHKLDYDNHTHVIDAGHYIQYGSSGSESYAEYLEDISKSDVIDYLRIKKIIPHYANRI